MNTPEIKACPFCGVGTGFVRPALGEEWDAKCDNCNCKLEGYPTEKEAIAAWNSRAGGRQPDAHKTAETKHVGISDGLAAIKRQLNARVDDMKLEMAKAETPSQKNCLATTILTINAIAWAIHDAQKEMAANESR